MSTATVNGKPMLGRCFGAVVATVLAAGLGPVGIGLPGEAAAHPATSGQSLVAAALGSLEPGPVSGLGDAPDSADPLVGLASWYGPGFHGRTTASGETYDAAARTVAHRTLPLGTIVRIDNLANGRQVVARVNDRGPYVDGRIVDCSYAVARALGFARSGVARVRVTPLDSLASAADFERSSHPVRLPWVKTPSSFMVALDEPLLEDDLAAAAPAVALGTWVDPGTEDVRPAPFQPVVRQASLVPYPEILHAGHHAASWLTQHRSRLATPLDLRDRLQRISLREIVRLFVA